MKTLIVTGTPGTGKTTLSKELAKKLNLYYVDVNKVVKKYNVSEGYDLKRKTKVIDVNKLSRALVKEINTYKNTMKSTIKKYSINKKTNNIKKIIKKNKNYNFKNIKQGVIIDSHLSHYLPNKYADLCIVTKCGLKELEKRLKKKKYSEGKVRENLDAEIFDVCLNEAKEYKHGVIVVDTTKGIAIDKISDSISVFLE
ncbi:AAA family ATPase [Candidatus Woesearchaeota archaeon]|nr:AAA family ATPase [Candidatus Woesearchaeota archaeon]